MAINSEPDKNKRYVKMYKQLNELMITTKDTTLLSERLKLLLIFLNDLPVDKFTENGMRPIPSNQKEIVKEILKEHIITIRN